MQLFSHSLLRKSAYCRFHYIAKLYWIEIRVLADRAIPHLFPLNVKLRDIIPILSIDYSMPFERGNICKLG